MKNLVNALRFVFSITGDIRLVAKGVLAITKTEGPYGLFLAGKYLIRRGGRSLVNASGKTLARTEFRYERILRSTLNKRGKPLFLTVTIDSKTSADMDAIQITAKSVFDEFGVDNCNVFVCEGNETRTFHKGSLGLQPDANPRASQAQNPRVEYISWVASPGDRLSKRAKQALSETLKVFPDLAFCYSDHRDLTSGRSETLYKSVFDRTLLNHVDVIGRSAFYRDAVFGSMQGAEEASKSAFYHVMEKNIPDSRVVHITSPLTELTRAPKVESKAPDTAAKNHTLVSIIIPTRDRVDLLAPCIESILKYRAGIGFEIIIVDNGSVEEGTQEYLDRLPRPLFKVIRDDESFNFSRLNNLAVREALGDVICTLNNDTEVTSDYWLSKLVESLDEDVRVVGPMLVYPDDSIQHAGVVLGLGGIADHAFRGENSDSTKYWGLLRTPRQCSAVTAACLVVSKSQFISLGGFREDLQVGFNDVDFCLRVRQSGGRVVFLPGVKLIHKESKSRGLDRGARAIRAGQEVVKMMKSWGPVIDSDPFYNPNLSLDASRSYSPRVTSPLV